MDTEAKELCGTLIEATRSDTTHYGDNIPRNDVESLMGNIILESLFYILLPGVYRGNILYHADTEERNPTDKNELCYRKR